MTALTQEDLALNDLLAACRELRRLWHASPGTPQFWTAVARVVAAIARVDDTVDE